MSDIGRRDSVVSELTGPDGNAQRGSAEPTAKARIGLEILEPRNCPATVTVNGLGHLVYTADAGEVDDIIVSYLSGTDEIEIASQNGDIIMAAGFSGDGTSTVSRAAVGVNSMEFFLGDMDDIILVNDLAGAPDLDNNFTIPMFIPSTQAAVVIRAQLGNDMIDFSASTSLTDRYFAFGGDLFDNPADGNDTVIGGAGNDTLFQGFGNDLLIGNGGDDFLTFSTADTGSGDDTLIGGPGNDILVGGVGNDLLLGEDGNDTLFANENNDTLDGGAGDDNLVGGTGDDSLAGGAGNDTLNGEAGNDTLAGGANDDRYVFNDGFGIDTASDSSGSDTLDFSAITGGPVTASLATSTVTNGPDTVTVAPGILGVIESLIGTAAVELLVGANVDSSWLLTAANAGTVTTSAGTLNISSFESFLGGTAADVFTVASGVSSGSVDGGGGVGSLVATDGSNGWDVCSANAGSLNSVVFNAIENLTGGSGDDIFRFSSGGPTITGTIDGGTGIDRIDAGFASSGVSVNLATGSSSLAGLLTNIENVTGSDFNDTLIGDANANVLSGGDGDDILEGGAGPDTLDGGNGNDHYIFGADFGLDQVIESNGLSGGFDTLDLSSFPTVLTFDFGDGLPADAPSGFGFDSDNFELLLLGQGDDFLVFQGDANLGSMEVDGGAGFDTIDYTLSNLTGTADLDAGIVPGTGSATNFEQVTGLNAGSTSSTSDTSSPSSPSGASETGAIIPSQTRRYTGSSRDEGEDEE